MVHCMHSFRWNKTSLVNNVANYTQGFGFLLWPQATAAIYIRSCSTACYQRLATVVALLLLQEPAVPGTHLKALALGILGGAWALDVRFTQASCRAGWHDSAIGLSIKLGIFIHSVVTTS